MRLSSPSTATTMGSGSLDRILNGPPEPLRSPYQHTDNGSYPNGHWPPTSPSIPTQSPSSRLVSPVASYGHLQQYNGALHNPSMQVYSPPPYSPATQAMVLHRQQLQQLPQPIEPMPHRRRESPQLPHAQLQTGERASLRMVARQTMSPAFSEDQQHSYPQAATQHKRRAADMEDVEEPPRSRQKVADGGAAPAKKRSSTAKNRNEAQTSALSGEEMFDFQMIPRQRAGHGEAPFDIIEVPTPAQLRREMQTSRCMSTRYKNKDIPRCISCTRRWAGDTCRFQHVRSIFWDKDGRVQGFSFTEQLTRTPAMVFPQEWNTKFEPSHLRDIKKTSAKGLLPILRKELAHLEHPKIVYRVRESEVRATCDTCMTSIFSGSWMCRSCGREACGDCFYVIEAITREAPAGSEEAAKVQEQRHLNMHRSPWFLSCAGKSDHGAKNFSPVTRFLKKELEDAVKQMDQIMRETAGEEEPTIGPPGLPDIYHDFPRNPGHLRDRSSSPSSNDSDQTVVEHRNIPAGPPGSIPSYEIKRYKNAELSEEVFRELWKHGQPLLVEDAGKNLQQPWTPQFLSQKYGGQQCVTIECQNEKSRNTTVGDFFGSFGKYEQRGDECWKVKDWPPTSEFKASCPDLYNDFSNAVPIPNYVRRDGVRNVGAHFPINTVAPDLGPKMYNANANLDDTDDIKGSTRLHMDMADALNILTYAAPDPDGKPGCAAWDLFRAEDSDKLRAFLNAKMTPAEIAQCMDPIHNQQFYINDNMRRELFVEYGVRSYRVYQQTGEAIFIPAGCAHQVRNLSDCIKIAIDFVSPENIARCEKLTREFRSLNGYKCWKEDVLQLRTMMWFAWLSCQNLEKKGVVVAS
uniref:Clavaminate synthase-like protein n=1 Tax=Mycena chlorophos TaxID=658473 RepID=A0ABQ0L4Q8_MYCCL|nr:clavaminate synthase-like protein [Mycena chlorophos]